MIMSGGGARTAYQVGVLRAIAAMLPRGAANPFAIICGTSAGATCLACPEALALRPTNCLRRITASTRRAVPKSDQPHESAK